MPGLCRTLPKSILVSLVILAPWLFGRANADTIVTYDLSGLTFNDGGTATGSFTVDIAPPVDPYSDPTGTITSAKIVTTPDPALDIAGTTYTAAGSLALFNPDTLPPFSSYPFPALAFLQFNAHDPLAGDGQISLELDINPFNPLFSTNIIGSASENVGGTYYYRNNATKGTLTLTGSGGGHLYLLSPFLLGTKNLADLNLQSILPTLHLGSATANGLEADNTSAAIALYQTTTRSDVTFTTRNGTYLLPYRNNLLTLSPTKGNTSLIVPASSLLHIGTLFYAAAIVQSPANGVTSFSFDEPVTVTARQNTSWQNSTITLVEPPVLFVHGLWGKESSLQTLSELLLNTTWGKHKHRPAIKLIGYTSNIAFDDLRVDGGVKTLAASIHDIMETQDLNHIVGGRVDIVAHSMGGLVARSSSGQSTYRSFRDRFMGQFHQIITIDTPESGSALAGYILLPWVEKGTLINKDGGYPKRVWQEACGKNLRTTVADCFIAKQEPIDDGAIASLVPAQSSLYHCANGHLCNEQQATAVCPSQHCKTLLQNQTNAQ